MNSEINTLRRSELAELKIRRLYEQHGYIKYRMNQFEEYEFYIENKNFLGYDSYITFMDRGGRLMALKPDVTLSIAKNTKVGAKESQRLYYSENIYRMIKNSGEFREISQTGLEFIGCIDIYKTIEVLQLAIKSLEIIDSSFVLTVSHMGIISGLLDSFKAPYEVKKKIIACIKSKNAHDAAIVCRENGIDEDTGRRIIGIIESRGSLCSEAVRLSALACNEKMKTAADELIRIGEFFESSEYRDRVVLDFDTVSHTQYYNGILFCGYIEGVAAAALVGGRYDNLLKKMGKDDLQAMGFAINFYELDRFLKEKSDNSVNAVVLYDDDTDPSYLTLTVEKLCEKGLRTICERCLPGGRAYDIVVDVKGKTGGEVLCNA